MTTTSMQFGQSAINVVLNEGQMPAKLSTDASGNTVLVGGDGKTFGFQYQLYASAIPVGVPPSGNIGTNGALTLGVFPPAGITFGATSGASVSCTASAAVFASTDVGKVITCDNGKQCTITAFTSSTVVTVNISGTLSTTAFAINVWQLAHPFRFVYGGVYLYFPAGALYAGSQPGLYYCVMSSTTVGTVYDNRLTVSGALAIPANPTPIASAAVGAYSSPTTNIRILSLTVNANALGLNGGVMTDSGWSFSPNTNGKLIEWQFGSVKFNDEIVNSATSKSGRKGTGFLNRGVPNRQYTIAPQGYQTTFAFGVQDNIQLSIDTTVTQPLEVLARLGSTNDYIILEAFAAELLPS